MIDYEEVRVDISPCSEAACDLLAAFLADAGYESFVPDESGLTAYINASLYDADTLENILNDFPMDVSLTSAVSLVEGRDWNEEWEKNYFKPITVGCECVIHSTFHTDVPKANFDIVIDPKMAFGTGHHATTSMMLEYLLALRPRGMQITDMGTGTGILSILAMMLGASGATAIEIDPGACENAAENIKLNHADGINLILGDASALADAPEADLFIANINRNIILADFDLYAANMKESSQILLSGFYEQDVPLIEARALPFGLKPAEKKVREGGWCALRLRR